MKNNALFRDHVQRIYSFRVRKSDLPLNQLGNRGKNEREVKILNSEFLSSGLNLLFFLEQETELVRSKIII